MMGAPVDLTVSYTRLRLVIPLLTLLCLSVLAFGSWYNAARVTWQPLLFNALHFPGAILLFFSLRSLAGVRYRHWVLPVALLAVIGVEVLQPFFGREGSLSDLSWGLGGLALSHILTKVRGWLFYLLLCAGALAMLYALVPLTRQLHQIVRAEMALPDLGGGQASWQSHWQPRADTAWLFEAESTGNLVETAVSLSRAEDGPGRIGMLWRNPGLGLADARGLCVDYTVPGSSKLVLRVHDREAGDWRQRFEHRWPAGAGRQSHCVQWPEFRQKQQRAVPAERIGWIFFGLTQPEKAPELKVYRVYTLQ